MATGKQRYERPTIVKQQSGLMNKIGWRSEAVPVTAVDGVAVPDLIAQFGSPLFVISESAIRRNQRRAQRVFHTRYPKVQFAWSYKTNYLNAVCAIFHQEGSWAEVVSEFEYDKARRLGVDGGRIIFNGPHKSTSALKKAVEDGARIHLDNFDELYKLIELTEGSGRSARVAVRVNMDTGVCPQWDRFGFNLENGEAWQALVRIMNAPQLKLCGLHAHIGTYIMAAEPYRMVASKLSELARSLRERFDHRIEYVDVGGGFASHNTLHGQYLPAEGMVPSLEQYADAISAGLLEHAPDPADLPTLIVETGRALIDDAAYLFSSVIAGKRLADGRRATIIDAGVNLLFTSLWFKHEISLTQDHSLFSEDTALYGPLCMNMDLIREQVSLPPLKPGDVLAIHDVGAYNMTQWMQFITLRPNVVMITADGRPQLVRKAETLDMMLQQEILPEHLHWQGQP